MRRSAWMVVLVLTSIVCGCLTGSEGTTDEARDFPLDDSPPTGEDFPTGADAGGFQSAAGAAPVEVLLEVANASAFFGEGSAVAVTVHGAPTPALRAGLALPRDIEMVAGTFSYDGALDEGTPVRLEGVLRATTAGEHVLRAWAEVPLGPGSRAAPSVLLAIVGDAQEARFESRAMPPPQVRVSLKPSDDLHDVIVRIESESTMDARVEWVVPGVFPADAPTDESVGLVPGAPRLREIELGRPEPWGEGAYVVSVHVYPDAAADGRLYSAFIAYWWEGDELRAGDRPPSAEPESAGSAPVPEEGDERAPRPVP